MPTSTFIYNLDGAMTAATGEPFSSIRRHNYTHLPIAIMGVGGSISLRYDSYGRRLHKLGAQTIFYRSGAQQNHALVELVDGDEIVYLFTPAGQNITRRADGYARVARDHLRSVRVERSSAAQITAHYSAYGEALFCGGGGGLRRAFAGYEPDAETGLYNANRRLYAPQLRLFISVDPRLQSASPYPYCGGDPFNLIDPTGGVSASTIASIISALVLVAAIVVTLATDGAAGPIALPEAVSGTVAAYAQVGAAIGAAASVVSGGAGLVAQAAQGEHISAWQAVRSMLIEPMIAAVSGGVGGAIAGVGMGAADAELAGAMMMSAAAKRMVFGMSALGGLAAGGITSVANAALDGTIATRGGWESIGIQMAMATGEALIFVLPYLRSRGELLWSSSPSGAASGAASAGVPVEAPPADAVSAGVAASSSASQVAAPPAAAPPVSASSSAASSMAAPPVAAASAAPPVPMAAADPVDPPARALLWEPIPDEPPPEAPPPEAPPRPRVAPPVRAPAPPPAAEPGLGQRMLNTLVRWGNRAENAMAGFNQLQDRLEDALGRAMRF